ncbi:MAG: hypothetical protein HQL50_07515 [Magnetococcales bacterium]|nr:hypothetical protein [Magnetococcales bacterium]
MTENSDTDITWFTAYGELVSSYFDGGAMPGDPIFPFLPGRSKPVEEVLHSGEEETGFTVEVGSDDAPASEALPPKEEKETASSESAAPSDSAENDPLFEHLDHDAYQKCQEITDTLRMRLRDERGGGPESATTQLKTFRKLLRKGTESALHGNPFHDLAMRIFRLNTDALAHRFAEFQQEQVRSTPPPIRITRPFKEIWNTYLQSSGGVFSKISETLVKTGISMKMVVGILLFCGSTLTTAKGVNDLLQQDIASSFTGGLFAGMEGETARLMVAVAIGLALSSAILDFKGRLFRGMAETGKVFRGLKWSFMYNPIWMVVAILLTTVSVKTNYDGLVLLLFKADDLGNQMQQITIKVSKGLGDPKEADPNRLGSLYDVQAALKRTTQGLKRQFLKVPEDELLGAASSGDARKGPRYWGKHMIVHGGYKPLQHDVVRVYKPTRLARNVDTMLRNSGIPLRRSLSQKIDAIRREYDENLAFTHRQVRSMLEKLGRTMQMQEYSASEFARLFSIEHYQINTSLRLIGLHLDGNMKAYERTAKKLQRLIDRHVSLLTKVDRAGGATANAYHIEAKIEVPKLESIEELKRGELPMARLKGLGELKDELMSTYGAVMGSTLLSVILLISILMDLADPFLYALMTSRLSRKDNARYDDYLEALKEWDYQFIIQTRKFCDDATTARILPGVEIVQKHEVENQLYLYFETVNPAVIDPEDQKPVQTARFWFFGLFGTARLFKIDAYNAWSETIRQFADGHESHFKGFLGHLFPGIYFKPGTPGIGLVNACSTMRNGQTSNRDALQAIIEALTKTDLTDPRLDGETPEMPTPVGRRRIGRAAAEQRKVKRILFNISWKRPATSILYAPRTRRSWLRQMGRVCQTTGFYLETLQDNITLILEFMSSTFPEIEHLLMQCMQDLESLPNRQVVEEIHDFPSLRHDITHTQEVLLSMLGLAQMQEEQLTLDAFVITKPDDVKNLSSMLQKQADGSTPMHDHIQQMHSRISRLSAQIEAILGVQKALFGPMPELKRKYLTPMEGVLSRFQNREMIEENLHIPELRERYEALHEELDRVWKMSGQANPDDMPGDSTDLINLDEARLLDERYRSEGASIPETMESLEESLHTAFHDIKRMSAKIDEAANILSWMDKAVEDIEKLQMKIKFRAMELQRNPFPSREKLKYIRENRGLIDDIPNYVIRTSSIIESFRNGETAMDNAGLALLRKQRNRVTFIQERLNNFLESIDKPGAMGIAAVDDGKEKGDFKKDFNRRAASARITHDVPIVFETADGDRFSGMSRNFSKTSACFFPDHPFKPPPIGMWGRLTLVSKTENAVFQAAVVRTSHREIAVQPVERIEEFKKLVSTVVFEEVDDNGLISTRQEQQETPSLEPPPAEAPESDEIDPSAPEPEVDIGTWEGTGPDPAANLEIESVLEEESDAEVEPEKPVRLEEPTEERRPPKPFPDALAQGVNRPLSGVMSGMNAADTDAVDAGAEPVFEPHSEPEFTQQEQAPAASPSVPGIDTIPTPEPVASVPEIPPAPPSFLTPPPAPPQPSAPPMHSPSAAVAGGGVGVPPDMASTYPGAPTTASPVSPLASAAPASVPTPEAPPPIVPAPITIPEVPSRPQPRLTALASAMVESFKQVSEILGKIDMVEQGIRAQANPPPLALRILDKNRKLLEEAATKSRHMQLEARRENGILITPAQKKEAAAILQWASQVLEAVTQEVASPSIPPTGHAGARPAAPASPAASAAVPASTVSASAPAAAPMHAAPASTSTGAVSRAPAAAPGKAGAPRPASAAAKGSGKRISYRTEIVLTSDEGGQVPATTIDVGHMGMDLRLVAATPNHGLASGSTGALTVKNDPQQRTIAYAIDQVDGSSHTIHVLFNPVGARTLIVAMQQDLAQRRRG